jgi:uncharacterized protein (TIGR03437 family)
MSPKYISVAALAVFSATAVYSQIPLNPTPSRVVGQVQLTGSSNSPNLVEGRELYSPQGLALDTSVTPPILYVADTLNNRVLGWKNAGAFTNGASADIVIGQADLNSTLPLGPGTNRSTGLSGPTGLVVRNGNLYVADSGNNRILRFPKPYEQGDIFPDLVIGQTNFTSRAANYTGQISNKGIFTASSTVAYRVGLAFDSAGNLWMSDPGNRRVLRFPNLDRAHQLGGFEADLEIGQFTFDTVATAMKVEAASRLVKDRFFTPSAVAFDPQGNLYVTDSEATDPANYSRVLVFRAPFATGMAASRIMGVYLAPTSSDPATPAPPIDVNVRDHTALTQPEGIFFLPGNAGIGVLDLLSSRILIFDALSQWPAETDEAISPQAKAVIGHNDFSNRQTNNGQPAPSATTLSLPTAAVMTSTELYLADSGNNRVLVLPYASGSFAAATRVIGQDRMETGSANLVEGREFQFSRYTSSGVAYDAAIVVDTRSDPPHLFVADPNNHRVLGFRDIRKVRPGDKADLVIGQPDLSTAMCNYPNNDLDRPTQSSLCFPVGLAIDNDGNLYVADSYNGRVLRFPDPFARQGTLPQADLVLGQSNFVTRITDASASKMSQPYGVTLMGDLGLWVSDVAHNRVLFFPRVNGAFTNGQSATKVLGQPNFTSSDAGNTDNRMRAPRLLSWDSDARTYVADSGNGRVLIFDSLNNLPAADARAATSISGLNNPRAVYVSQRTGEIWITNSFGASVQRYARYDQLQLSPRAAVTIPLAVGNQGVATLAVTQDQFGDLFVADGASRVAIFYPGIVSINGASYLTTRSVLAPGMIAIIKPAGADQGQTFGTDTALNTDLPRPVPLPRELADIQVLMNDQPVPLFAVLPGQINIQVPMSAPTSGTVDVTVVRKSTGQILGTSALSMGVASPGMFHTGLGTARPALVVNADGTVNSPTNPAVRGTKISIFATGQGYVAGAPADGEAPAGPVPTEEKPRVWMGTSYTDSAGESEDTILYSGLAPGQVGVWQIDVRIPQTVAKEAQVPIFILFKSINSLDPNTYTTVFSVTDPK